MYDSYDYGAMFAALGVWALVVLAIAIVVLVANCKIFVKMGRKWWEAIIPFYNLYVLSEMTFGNGWWFLLMFVSLIPVVGGILGLLFSIIWSLRLGKSFGQGTGFCIGLILLSPIFTLILGFGDAQYSPLQAFELSHPFDFEPAGYTDASYTTVDSSASTTSAEKAFCTNCGAELQPGQEFCPSCGTKRI